MKIFGGVQTPNDPPELMNNNASLTPSSITPTFVFAQGNNELHQLNPTPIKNAYEVTKEDFEFCCEPCDLGFQNENLLQNHMNTHEKCTVEGCNFSSSPFVMKVHLKSVHHPRIARLIKRLDTPEAIEKWKQERKKNYPTSERINIKNEEMIAKGIDPSKKTNRNPGSKPSKYEKYLETNQSNTSNAITDTSQTISSDNNDAPTEQPSNIPTHLNKKPYCRFFQEGNCKKGDQCNYLHETDPHFDPKRKYSSNKNRQRPQTQINNKKKKKPSLLELLSNKEVITESETNKQETK